MHTNEGMSVVYGGERLVVIFMSVIYDSERLVVIFFAFHFVAIA